MMNTTDILLTKQHLFLQYLHKYSFGLIRYFHIITTQYLWGRIIIVKYHYCTKRYTEIIIGIIRKIPYTTNLGSCLQKISLMMMPLWYSVSNIKKLSSKKLTQEFKSKLIKVMIFEFAIKRDIYFLKYASCKAIGYLL